MNIIKTYLGNRMFDDWLNDLIPCFIKKGIFKEFDEDRIKETFQASKNHALDLSSTVVEY